MTRFVEQAIARAGLSAVLPSRQRGDVDAVRALVASLGEIDLLALGAVADAVRSAEVGDVVRVHPSEARDVLWMHAREARGGGPNELALLRAVATARVTGPVGARIGVDWGHHGLELAQVALGFGATDLTGPITRKSGLLISEDELKKVKGKGMVQATALKQAEIAALVRNAGRACDFVADEGRRDAGRAGRDEGSTDPQAAPGAQSGDRDEAAHA